MDGGRPEPHARGDAMRRLAWILVLIALSAAANAEDTERAADDAAPQEAATEAEDVASDADPGGPKTLAGMSILGNEEAPKSLVIIPWKSSEIGSDLGLDDSLDERAEPVDREVFLRELEFFEIRSGE